MDEAERAAFRRRLAIRWGTVLGVALVLLAFWRLFLLICPLRDWPVLGWSLGPADAAAWDAPQIPALVAENALENGGAIGTALGRRLYARTLAPPGDSPVSTPAPSYASLHLPYAWLGETNLQWSVEAWTGSDPNLVGSLIGFGTTKAGPPPPPGAKVALVQVSVQAHLAEAVQEGACTQVQPVPVGIARDYLVVRTARGWRVAYVYVRDPGTPLVAAQATGVGTAAQLLAGCR